MYPIHTSQSVFVCLCPAADPWHLLSITEDQTPTQQSYVQAVTYEAGHCAPMTTPTANDPPSLKAARQKVESFLGGILGITPETSFQN